MNSSNSRARRAGRTAPTADRDRLQIVYTDGRCTRATAAAVVAAMHQLRDDRTAQQKRDADDRQRRLAAAKSDRAAARQVQREIEDAYTRSTRWACHIRVRPPKVLPPEEERSAAPAIPRNTHREPRSSWVVDAKGTRGVHFQLSYIGRRSPNYQRGAPRQLWLYVARPDAVLTSESGEPLIFSNCAIGIEEGCDFWDAAEAASVRKNAKIQYQAIVAFDADAPLAEQLDALDEWLKSTFEPLNLPYTAAVHRPSPEGDQRNVHAHVLFSLRPARRVAESEWEFADSVVRELDGRAGVMILRTMWAHAQTLAAEHAGSGRAYTPLSYANRGLNLLAGEHLGPARSAQQRRGDYTPAARRNALRGEINRLNRQLADTDRKIAALSKIRSAVEERLAKPPQFSMPQPRRTFRTAPKQTHTAPDVPMVARVQPLVPRPHSSPPKAGVQPPVRRDYNPRRPVARTVTADTSRRSPAAAARRVKTEPPLHVPLTTTTAILVPKPVPPARRAPAPAVRERLALPRLTNFSTMTKAPVSDQRDLVTPPAVQSPAQRATAPFNAQPKFNPVFAGPSLERALGQAPVRQPTPVVPPPPQQVRPQDDPDMWQYTLDLVLQQLEWARQEAEEAEASRHQKEHEQRLKAEQERILAEEAAAKVRRIEEARRVEQLQRERQRRANEAAKWKEMERQQADEKRRQDEEHGASILSDLRKLHEENMAREREAAFDPKRSPDQPVDPRAFMGQHRLIDQWLDCIKQRFRSQVREDAAADVWFDEAASRAAKKLPPYFRQRLESDVFTRAARIQRIARDRGWPGPQM